MMFFHFSSQILSPWPHLVCVSVWGQCIANQSNSVARIHFHCISYPSKLCTTQRSDKEALPKGHRSQGQAEFNSDGGQQYHMPRRGQAE